MSRDDLQQIMKPCPFCGHNDGAIIVDEKVRLCKVNCCNCEAQGPWEWSKEKAIEEWNRVSERYFKNEPRGCA